MPTSATPTTTTSAVFASVSAVVITDSLMLVPNLRATTSARAASSSVARSVSPGSCARSAVVVAIAYTRPRSGSTFPSLWSRVTLCRASSSATAALAARSGARGVEVRQRSIADRYGDESMTLALRGLVEAEEHEVRPRLEGALTGSGLTDGGERAHLEIVGERDPREAEVPPQQVGRDTA